MNDDGPATLLAGVAMTLAVPFQTPVRLVLERSQTARNGEPSRSLLSLALIWIAFVPLILVYEAFAVPLVAGAAAFAGLLILPAGIIGHVAVFVARALRRARRAPAGAATMATPTVAVRS